MSEGQRSLARLTTMAKAEKTLIVIVDKLGYTVPASIVPALRRTFGTAKVHKHGMTMASARRFVAERIVWRRVRVEFQHENPKNVSVSYSTARRVADVLAERLVRKWLSDGYLESVARGRYRRSRS